MEKNFSMETMLENIVALLPKATKEVKENDVIDGIYKYEVSPHVTTNDDKLVSITLYNYDGELPKLFLSGISDKGVVDIIDYSSADKEGLEFLLTQLKDIREKGNYSEAREWACFG